MEMVDFAAAFQRMAADGTSEATWELESVRVRLVRVSGDASGNWHSHSDTAETVVVWQGDFLVQFRDGALSLSTGQCCVVPIGAEHRGTSQFGAEIILFQTSAAKS